jgi:hypothetical protein
MRDSGYLGPGTWDPGPETWHLYRIPIPEGTTGIPAGFPFVFRKMPPWVMHPASCILHPASCILHLASCILYPISQERFVRWTGEPSP